MRGISWLAGDLLASQEGLCSIELVIIFIDIRIFVVFTSALVPLAVCTLTNQGNLHGCSWCYTHMQLLSETSLPTRRMCNSVASQYFNVKHTTFIDPPVKQFYVITMNSPDDDLEITANCLEIKCK
jgi:hypothetical protein